jgi:hypothetical protein
LLSYSKNPSTLRKLSGPNICLLLIQNPYCLRNKFLNTNMKFNRKPFCSLIYLCPYGRTGRWTGMIFPLRVHFMYFVQRPCKIGILCEILSSHGSDYRDLSSGIWLRVVCGRLQTFQRNIVKLLSEYKASHPERQSFSV